MLDNQGLNKQAYVFTAVAKRGIGDGGTATQHHRKNHTSGKGGGGGGGSGTTFLSVLGLFAFGLFVGHATRSRNRDLPPPQLHGSGFHPRAGRKAAAIPREEENTGSAITWRPSLPPADDGSAAYGSSPVKAVHLRPQQTPLSPLAASAPFPPLPPPSLPFLPHIASVPRPASSSPLDHANSQDCTGSAGMPASIKSLCTVVKQGIWPLMQTFFDTSVNHHNGATSPAPFTRLKIAVINLEESSKQGSLVASPCAKAFNKTYFEGRQQTRDYAQKFASELLIPLAMKASPYMWEDPLTADWIIVELCSIGRARQGQIQQQIPILMQTTKVGSALWAQRKNRLLLTLTGDHGPCKQSNEKAGQFRERPWIESQLKGVPMLLNEGSTQGGCYDASKDITVPSTAVVVGSFQRDPPAQSSREATETEQCSTLPLNERRHLGFFAGKIDSEVRKYLYEAVGDNKVEVGGATESGNVPGDVSALFFPMSANKVAYTCGLRSSVFCIAPRGNAAWSPRLDEAMNAECIPVIMADNYDPPWSSVLDYSSFTVRIAENRVQDLAKILGDIPTVERERLHSNLLRAKMVFRWTAWNTVAYGEDASPLLAFELWQRKNSL